MRKKIKEVKKTEEMKKDNNVNVSEELSKKFRNMGMGIL